jgi:hypothetical protein
MLELNGLRFALDTVDAASTSVERDILEARTRALVRPGFLRVVFAALDDRGHNPLELTAVRFALDQLDAATTPAQRDAAEAALTELITVGTIGLIVDAVTDTAPT